MAAIGACIFGGGLLMRTFLPTSGKAWAWSGLVIYAGAMLDLAALVSFGFMRAAQGSLEWFLAWRYLRREQRSLTVLVIGIALHAVAGGLLIAAALIKPAPIGGIALEAPPIAQILQQVSFGIFIFAGWILVYGAFHLRFSVFTTISMFGVYLGSSTLVVVLSVMGGFEHDLRRNILGTNAHVVVSKRDSVFRGYAEVQRKIAAHPQVKAVAPFIESEVMVASQTNISGVILRGINPSQVTSVTDLRQYLRGPAGQGELKNLLHPERLSRIPAVPWGRPMVTPPLGGEPSSQPTSGPASAPLRVPASAPASVAMRLPTTLPTLPAVGRLLSRPVYPGVIVGAELARNLRLYVGDDVNLVSPLGGMSPAGPIPKARPFRVAGIFSSGRYEYDSQYAYVTLEVARRFLGLGDEITGMEIKLHDVANAEAMAHQLGVQLGAAYDAKDWQQLNKGLFSALKLEKVVMFIVLTFIILVASFSIVTNLIMIVLEKGREIGVIKAIGAADGSVLRVFVHAGLYIGIIGTLVGVSHGMWWCLYIKEIGLPINPEVFYIARLPVRIDGLEVGIVAVAAVTLSIIATIYPALRAARLTPVDGLRFDGG